MNLKRNKHLITDRNKYTMYGIVAGLIVYDILYNQTHGTLIFKELPRETLMTSRVYRHLHNGTITEEDEIAENFAIDYLNGFDPSDWHVNLSDKD